MFTAVWFSQLAFCLHTFGGPEATLAFVLFLLLLIQAGHSFDNIICDSGKTLWILSNPIETHTSRKSPSTNCFEITLCILSFSETAQLLKRLRNSVV
jgi:hypothetical protein